MLSHKKSLDILKKTNALLEGHFVLSSGLHSSKYIQCAKLLSYPHKADPICKSLAKKIKKNFTNFIAVLKQKSIKFKIIRHEEKRNAFTQKILKYFKKN